MESVIPLKQGCTAGKATRSLQIALSGVSSRHRQRQWTSDVREKARTSLSSPADLGHWGISLGKGRTLVGSGQWLDTVDTFPSSYCCFHTLLHPGSSSSTALAPSGSPQSSERACVSAAPWTLLDTSLPHSGEAKSDLYALPKSMETAPNTAHFSYEGKKMWVDCCFPGGIMSKKVCK